MKRCPVCGGSDDLLLKRLDTLVSYHLANTEEFVEEGEIIKSDPSGYWCVACQKSFELEEV